MTERAPLRGVLSDVRTESIVEIARWDLDLAEHLVTAWDSEPSLLPSLLAADPEKLNRLVWAAQARVLLPWIEERRSTLYVRVTGIIGAPRLGSILPLAGYGKPETTWLTCGR